MKSLATLRLLLLFPKLFMGFCGNEKISSLTVLSNICKYCPVPNNPVPVSLWWKLVAFWCMQCCIVTTFFTAVGFCDIWQICDMIAHCQLLMFSGRKWHLAKQPTSSRTEQERPWHDEQWLHDEPRSEYQYILLRWLLHREPRSAVRSVTTAAVGRRLPPCISRTCGISSSYPAGQWCSWLSARQDGGSGLGPSDYILPVCFWGDRVVIGSWTAIDHRQSWIFVDSTAGVSLSTGTSEISCRCYLCISSSVCEIYRYAAHRIFGIVMFALNDSLELF